MFWLSVAAQLAMPQPIRPQTWLRVEDLPLEEVGSGEARLVAFRVTVRPDGTLQDCAIEVTSGRPKLDELTCRIMRRRARFKPAVGVSGQPIHAVHRSSSVWAVNPPASYVKPVDMQLKVSALPKGGRSPAVAHLVLAVDTRGVPTACAANGSVKENVGPLLIQLACRQLQKSYKALPARTDAGVTVDSVQNASVSFVTD